MVNTFQKALHLVNGFPGIRQPLKRYFRVDEVAVYFAISARTVYRLLDEGDLQATRIRGCVRVSSEELKRFEALPMVDNDMP